jgi:hypothetical protein
MCFIILERFNKMPKYRIIFSGTPKGGLNPLYNEFVDKVVEASNIGKAMLMAYETHEHIDRVTLGSPGIYVEEVVERTAEDEELMIFNYRRRINRMNDCDIMNECMKLKWFRVNIPDIRGTDILWNLVVCSDICAEKGIKVPVEYGKFGSL